MSAYMRAVEYSGAGGPEVLRVAQRPRPVPGPGEVLIKVSAAALNRADVQQRRGLYPPPPGVTDIPGLEVSGIVSEVNGDVGEYTTGMPVCALLPGGGYAEYVSVPAGQVMPVPKGLTMDEAAGLPEAVCTVWSNLFMQARVAADDWVLIHGGSGGIGTMATQLVTAVGARAVVTAGTAQKIEYCKTFGAVAGIDYLEEDFVTRMLEISAGHGADVVLDVVGAKYLDPNLRVLALGGRLVVIGLQSGADASLNMRLLLTRRATVMGTTLRARPLSEKTRIVREVIQDAWPYVEAGTVRSAVEATYPFEHAMEAHRFFDSGEHTGKILLKF